MKIAIIGDIHGYWNNDDVSFFNNSEYDFILFTGDLPNLIHTKSKTLTKSISKLTIPAFIIAGNHDSVNLFQLIAELKNWNFLKKVLSINQKKKYENLQKSLYPAKMDAYNHFSLAKENQKIDLMLGRPLSGGGGALNSPVLLKKKYSIESLGLSSDKMKALIDISKNGILIVLAHNGPFGLGGNPEDIWGNDFNRNPKDLGDPDLENALNYAQTKNFQKIIVIAGHMHHKIHRKNASERSRKKIMRKENIIYLNCAKVPRIKKIDLAFPAAHYHYELAIEKDFLEIAEIEVINRKITQRLIL